MKKWFSLTVMAAICSLNVMSQNGIVINNVEWATRNVNRPGTFTANPEDFGMFYQWNRKIGWSVTNPLINSDGGTKWNLTVPKGKIWKKANDPCPTGWRVPTLDEFGSLFDADKVSLEWANLNGVTGLKFTDKSTSNSIFLPAAGRRNINYEGTLDGAGSIGEYWSNTPWWFDTSDGSAYILRFGFEVGTTRTVRSAGLSIRAVAE